MTVALAIASVLLFAWAIAAFMTGWQRLACVLAFFAGMAIDGVFHLTGVW